jgi:hypothetical protein
VRHTYVSFCIPRQARRSSKHSWVGAVRRWTEAQHLVARSTATTGSVHREASPSGRLKCKGEEKGSQWVPLLYPGLGRDGVASYEESC